MQLIDGAASKSSGPHVRGGLTSMLRMCSSEQLGNDLRRAVRDLISYAMKTLMLGLRHVS